MQESRASVGKIIAELAKRVCWGWGGGFSESRNASEGRTDMEVVVESARDGFGFGLAS